PTGLTGEGAWDAAGYGMRFARREPPDVRAYQRRKLGALPLRLLGLLPPPLWGRVGEGGGTARVRWRHLRKNRATPTPNPSPEGGGERTESVAREKRCARCGVTALSFAGVARAAMLACNDHNGFAVIAHGPHCDHRADAVRGGAGARAAGGHDRAGSACGYKCTAACSDSARAGRSLEKRPPPPPPPPPPARGGAPRRPPHPPPLPRPRRAAQPRASAPTHAPPRGAAPPPRRRLRARATSMCANPSAS